MKTIAGLVGSAELAAEYIRPDEDFYLSRGHLAPNAGYIYYAHQVSLSIQNLATFIFKTY